MEALRSEDEEEDSMETSPRLNQRVQKAQRYEIDASSKSSSLDLPDIKIVECRYVSKISYPLRPPLIASCIIIETCSSLMACVVIDEIVLNGMPSSYYVESMAHSGDSRYVMHVRDFVFKCGLTYETNIDTHNITMIIKPGYVSNIVTRDDIIVLFQPNFYAAVLESRHHTGYIDVKCKHMHSTGCVISGRYCQELYDDIYVLDDKSKLWRISWHDIIARRYTSHTVVDKNVEDFYMHEHGNAILKTTGIIALSGGQSIDTQGINDSIRWSAVIRSANRWIACGDNDEEKCLILLVSTIKAS